MSPKRYWPASHSVSVELSPHCVTVPESGRRVAWRCPPGQLEDLEMKQDILNYAGYEYVFEYVKIKVHSCVFKGFIFMIFVRKMNS